MKLAAANEKIAKWNFAIAYAPRTKAGTLAAKPFVLTSVRGYKSAFKTVEAACIAVGAIVGVAFNEWKD